MTTPNWREELTEEQEDNFIWWKRQLQGTGSDEEIESTARLMAGV